MPPPPQGVVRRPWRPRPGKVHLLPPEILSEIFLLVMEDQIDVNRMQLMHVCQRWYEIMLSTPGVPSELRIRKSTAVEFVLAAIQGRRWLLNVTINMDNERTGQDFNADAFNVCFMAAIQAASRWRSLSIRSFPQPGEFQIEEPLHSLVSFNLDECDLGGLFEPLMTAITTTATRLTRLNLGNLDAIRYLMQPTCLRVFCSLTGLVIRLSKRMESLADILPHLHKLESLQAQHLHLPIYSPDRPLPLIKTLNFLYLKSVSVQWMAGKVFPVLRTCFIIFPHHISTICLQPVTMPSCTYLIYQSNDLHPLGYFHHLPLAALSVTNGQWNARRGNRQLMAMRPLVVASAQNLIRLDLDVRCSEQLLAYMLSLMPALEYLSLELVSPHALNGAFFRAFVTTKSYASSACEMGTLPSLPLCLKLVELQVRYKRWLRGPERTALLPIFSDIVSSRWSEEGFDLILRFDGLAQDWSVSRRVEAIHEVAKDESTVIGISSLHGIIPLEVSTDDPLMEVPLKEVPFREAEYLVAGHQLSIRCLLTLHHLVELRVGNEQDILPTAPPSNLPLLHTLKVLAAENIHPSFLAGQVFHELERCRLSLHGEGPNLSQGQVTQMPVCTRLDVEDLTLLATFKLPQICELGVSFDHPEFDMIWEKHIAVNANLSGLELLHVYEWHQQADLIQALRYLPKLKSLILGNGSCLDGDFFGEFVPMRPNETSAVEQSSDGSQNSVILCPVLRIFLIEEFDSTEQLELIPILKEMVTLRASGGSSLKRCTLFDIELGRMFKLIGDHGSFVVKNVALSRDHKPFRLDI